MEVLPWSLPTAALVGAAAVAAAVAPLLAFPIPALALLQAPSKWSLHTYAIRLTCELACVFLYLETDPTQSVSILIAAGAAKRARAAGDQRGGRTERAVYLFI